MSLCRSQTQIHGINHQKVLSNVDSRKEWRRRQTSKHQRGKTPHSSIPSPTRVHLIEAVAIWVPWWAGRPWGRPPLGTTIAPGLSLAVAWKHATSVPRVPDAKNREEHRLSQLGSWFGVRHLYCILTGGAPPYSWCEDYL
jgi:hypothetical protein